MTDGAAQPAAAVDGAMQLTAAADGAAQLAAAADGAVRLAASGGVPIHGGRDMSRADHDPSSEE